MRLRSAGVGPPMVAKSLVPLTPERPFRAAAPAGLIPKKLPRITAFAPNTKSPLLVNPPMARPLTVTLGALTLRPLPQNEHEDPLMKIWMLALLPGPLF